MGNDRPTSEISPSGNDRNRFLEQARAAADYIANNVRGRMVPVTPPPTVMELYAYVKERGTDEDLPSPN